jgi:hypothetical protein
MLAGSDDIDLHARRAYLSRLAPLVGLLAACFAKGPRAREAAPLLHEPPVAAWVPLRPSPRKVLAFDAWARLPLVIAAVAAFYAGLNVLMGLGRIVFGNLVGGLVHASVAALVFMLVVLGGSLAAAARLAYLDRVFARCVVIPSRVTSVIATQQMNPKTRRTSPALKLTVAYLYAGTLCEAKLDFERALGALVDPTPALLVDPQNPHEIRLHALYI